MTFFSINSHKLTLGVTASMDLNNTIFRGVLEREEQPFGNCTLHLKEEGLFFPPFFFLNLSLKHMFKSLGFPF
jgi:hypothetical protein